MKDPNLRRCSLASRGMWVDLMCLMFECEERGVLATAGHAWSDDEIAQAVGGDHDVALSCLRELVGKAVASRNQSGSVYCRRMVRDEVKRKADAQRQRKSRLSRSCHSPVTPIEDDVEASGSSRDWGEGKGSAPPDVFESLKSALSAMYGRPLTESWGYVEEFTLASVSKRPRVQAEFDALQAFKTRAEFFPESIQSLLEKWQQTLDRSRNENNKTGGRKCADRNEGTANKSNPGDYSKASITS